MIPAKYPRLVELSATEYRAHLVSQSTSFSEPAQRAAIDLCALLARVKNPDTLKDRPLGYSAQRFERANENDAKLLVNEWCLGFGRDDAPVLVMGTEEAYSPKPVDMGQWNAICSVVWACGGDQSIVDALDSRLAAPEFPPQGYEQRREWHVYANDFYRVHQAHRDPDVPSRWVRSGRHTWKILAQILAGRSNWLSLLQENKGTLGDMAYQIDLSAHPARLAADGAPP